MNGQQPVQIFCSFVFYILLYRPYPGLGELFVEYLFYCCMSHRKIPFLYS